MPGVNGDPQTSKVRSVAPTGLEIFPGLLPRGRASLAPRYPPVAPPALVQRSKHFLDLLDLSDTHVGIARYPEIKRLSTGSPVTVPVSVHGFTDTHQELENS